MQPMEDGMELDPNVLIQTQNNIIGQNAVRMVQMESAIQQLRAENHNLRQSLAQHDDVVEEGDESDADTG
jgi:hypothetical protein